MPMKMHSPGTNTFLFSWNPFKFQWPEIGEESEMVRKGEKVIDSWTCSSYKKIREGRSCIYNYCRREAGWHLCFRVCGFGAF
jgi:hypothetical protein